MDKNCGGNKSLKTRNKEKKSYCNFRTTTIAENCGPSKKKIRALFVFPPASSLFFFTSPCTLDRPSPPSLFFCVRLVLLIPAAGSDRAVGGRSPGKRDPVRATSQPFGRSFDAKDAFPPFRRFLRSLLVASGLCNGDDVLSPLGVCLHTACRSGKGRERLFRSQPAIYLQGYQP